MRRPALVAVAAVVALYGVARAALSTAPAREALRDRVRAALAPRLGDVAVGEPEVDALFRVSFGPIEVPLPGGGDRTLRVERVRARPSVVALLRGRVEPARVELRGVALPPELGVGALDADLALARGPRGERVSGTVWLAGGGRVHLELARGREGITARLRGPAIGVRELPAGLRSEAGGIRSGELSVELDAEAAPDLSRAEARVRTSARDVFLSGARIGPEPVGPLRVEARGVLAWDGATRRVTLREGRLSDGELTVVTSGELRVEADLPFVLALRADDVDYRALLARLPPALSPPAAAPRPPGAFGARLDVGGPLARPAAWTVDAALDLSALRAAARRSPPPAIAGPFVHRPDPADPGSTIEVGAGNPEFVPLAELPEHVVRAVTTSEDAGFFGHSGFDFDELRNAIAEAGEAGRLGRGGSTITQQLAKNLYLSPERTLVRKAREALIAIGLEGSLPKRRLLEIYLNVVEWGPGLWGIGPAARHWFGKDARELTAKEAAFLASIIPSPVRYHAMYERGRPSDRWEARVNDLLFKMTEQGALSDDQLVEGLHAPLTFAGG